MRVPDLSRNDYRAVQTYVAATSVGASTVRGYAEGTKEDCEQFLVDLPLSSLRRRKPASFRAFLDTQTDNLIANLEKSTKLQEGEYFGLARKVLNIFLHNAYSNQFLCKKYRLWKYTSQYEVPIDSKTAAGIRKDYKALGFRRSEPWKWKGLLHHESDANDRYQDAAEIIAQNDGTTRVRLDAYYYPGHWSWDYRR